MKKDNKLGKVGNVIDIIIRCVLLVGIVVVLIILIIPSNRQMFEIKKDTVSDSVSTDSVSYNISTDDNSETGASEPVSEDGRININTATAHELRTLDGIGETKAYAIIEYREEHGNFKSVDELVNVSGIGEKTVDRLRDMITV